MNDLFQLLAAKGYEMLHYPTLGCDRITILGKQMNLVPGLQTDYYSINILNNKDIYCCVHLPSPIYGNSEGIRNAIINRIITDIESTEIELDADNTVIVGDFNANPFDNKCIDATGLHGIPILEVTEKQKRTIAGKDYKMFYNPMWRFFGDEKDPYGTFYFPGNNTNNIFWHIYDQVIIRPSLKDRFISSSLRIITETETRYLINNQGHPDKNISDHLPIIFEIQEDD